MEPFAIKGDPAKRERWQKSWREAGAFRRKMQMTTLLPGLLLLWEAAAQVIIVLLLLVRLSVIASNIPGMLLILFLALIGRFYLKPAAEQFMGERDEQSLAYHAAWLTLGDRLGIPVRFPGLPALPFLRKYLRG